MFGRLKPLTARERHTEKLISRDEINARLDAAERELQRREFRRRQGMYNYLPSSFTPEITLSNGAQVNKDGHVVLRGEYLGSLASLKHQATLQAYDKWLSSNEEKGEN